MALTYTNFETFAEVEAHYNNITPLRGKDNVGKDIRPIGDRARKWERIVKISANCYALSDGYHFGDEYFGSWHYGAKAYKAALKDMVKYAPIVWRKKRDGTEEVTLRNGYGLGHHNSLYAFLQRHTPKGMWFRNRNNDGKHYIQVGRTDHYLAKTRTAPREVYDAVMSSGYSLSSKKWIMKHDCNSALVFRKAENGDWAHVEGTGRPLPQAPRVNKEVKAKYKDAIKKFFEWGMAMSPLLPLEDNKYKWEQEKQLLDLKPVNLRNIISDEDHPLRLSLWVSFAANCTDNSWIKRRKYYTKTVETAEDLQRVRSRYNAFINKKLDFMTK